MGLLTASGLVAGYSATDEILKGVDFSVEKGEIVTIIGPNGAGKSTLLKTIAGLLKLKSGTIVLAGKRIDGRPAREISTLGIAFVPQEHNIFPTMSVAENLEIGGYVDRRGTQRKIAALLERFPMLAPKRRHAARTLSGGQRQVLAMAMALAIADRAYILVDGKNSRTGQAADLAVDPEVKRLFLGA
jgi:branched-chain amino acid transport system ATP-binding protein